MGGAGGRGGRSHLKPAPGTDGKLQGKCNGFRCTASRCDSELYRRPDVITCLQDISAAFYGDDDKENQVRASSVVQVVALAGSAPGRCRFHSQRRQKGVTVLMSDETVNASDGFRVEWSKVEMSQINL